VTTTIFVLEVAINAGMIVEVGVRGLAFWASPEQRRQFLRSRANVLDCLLVPMCTLTLVLMPLGVLGEMELDAALLVMRNLLQWLRLAAVIRRSSERQIVRDIRLDTILPLDWV
jgi:hypothetical protein